MASSRPCELGPAIDIVHFSGKPVYSSSTRERVSAKRNAQRYLKKIKINTACRMAFWNATYAVRLIFKCENENCDGGIWISVSVRSAITHIIKYRDDDTFRNKAERKEDDEHVWVSLLILFRCQWIYSHNKEWKEGNIDEWWPCRWAKKKRYFFSKPNCEVYQVSKEKKETEIRIVFSP